jgi:hypothetical protein
MERPNTSQGHPLDKTDIYETLFAFVDEVLLQFSSNETGENRITQNLEISLNEQTRRDDTFFAFQNQYEEGRSTADIGVYLRSNKFFFCWIEAKRLPTPKEKNRDEREYLIVNQDKVNGKKKFKGNGGIQRFKENKHASDLPFSIMIGYIQANDSDYWLNKVNEWITELINTNTGFWLSEDYLRKYNSDKCDRYISEHLRKDNTPITLHHYWITTTGSNKKSN